MKSTAAKHRKMEVACFAKEPRSDDLLGRATVDIGEILRKGEFDGVSLISVRRSQQF